MGKIKLEGYMCERCSHKWVPRENQTREPKVCPRCKSPYYDIPRKLKNKRRVNGKRTKRKR